MDVGIVAFCVVTLVFAGSVKGLLGLGMPLVALALLAFILPPKDAAILMLGPIFFTNLWQLMEAQSPMTIVRRLAPLLVTTLIATYISSGILTAADTTPAKLILGGAVVAYGLLILSGRRPSISARNEVWAGPVTGAITGIIAGATGVVLMPVVPYLQAIGYDKDHLIQAQATVFIVAGIALSSSLFLQREITAHAALLSCAAVIPSMAGIRIGQRLRATMDVDRFRLIFCLALVMLGLYIMLAALG